jgi:acyl-CoA synthetase (AMP-forming)/AMP-acid ligase II
MAFDEDGWFKTGDIALRQIFDGKVHYRILGRNSTDIIKVGAIIESFSLALVCWIQTLCSRD